jgi:hypothetical protein
MSKQAMFPESEGQQPEEEAEVYKPYYWSTRPVSGKSGKTGDIPKNEHPSTFEDTIPPYSYPAQEPMPPVQEQPYAEPVKRQQQQRQQPFSPDGDAFEHGYRPYMGNYNQGKYTAQQVPPWARPQPHNHSVLRWLPLLILGLIFIRPLLFIITHLLAVVGIFVGVAALAILVPIIFVLILAGIISIIVLIVLSSLGIPVWRRRPWGGYRRGYWRGPWGPWW